MACYVVASSCEWLAPAVGVVTALIVAFLGPYIGLKVFFKQKAYELVRNRYLDGCVDEISSNIEYALSVFRHNWARSMAALKNFRDLGKDMDRTLYSDGYIEIDPASFKVSKSYVLNELVGDNAFFEAYQSVYAFVQSSSNFFRYDFGSMVRCYVEEGIELNISGHSREELAAEYFSLLLEKNEQSYPYYHFLSEIHKLAMLFEREKFDFSTIKEFSARKDVKEIVERLKKDILPKMEQDKGI